MNDTVMTGVTEYGEDMDVRLGYDKGRPVIVASNEAGYCGTFVDLIQLLEWVNENMPELKHREWVGLTKEEVRKIFDVCEAWERGYVASMVEVALKEKNA